MDKETVRPIMHPDRPIEVSPADAAVLRARGLLAEDTPPAADKPPKTAAGAKAKAETEGNTPS
jgi:hypothetical protein